MKRSHRTLGILTVAAVAAGAWWLSGQRAESNEARHLVNRVWVERMPTDSRDVFGKLVVLDTPDGKFGVVGRSSTWVHHYEVFLWRLAGDRLSAFFPQHGVRDRVRVRTWACEGEAPEPFELCLEVSNERGRGRFYSMRAWEVRPHDVEGTASEIPGMAGALEILDAHPGHEGAVPDDGVAEVPGRLLDAVLPEGRGAGDPRPSAG
ncbi:MAG: hypothetical protein D6705_06100 [Deltaproteobacteria bacterium]|nr:MAG: hypothetical protein D6705_06100 [Deltaproteobacteria bacterium]